MQNARPFWRAFFLCSVWVLGLRVNRISDVRRDRRPMKEQVKSGFIIAGKLVAALCIAAAFLSGCALVEEAASSSEIVIGWLLIAVSIVVMAFTVRFWAAGFFGFIAYAALRLLGGTLVARSLRVSPLHMLSVAASLFAMSILCIRFASGKPRITQIDRASLLLAAICALYVSAADGLVQKRSSTEHWQRRARVVVVSSPSLTSGSVIGSPHRG